MGFHRQGQPRALDRAEVTALFSKNIIVARLVAEEVTIANARRDPFALDHDCLNPAGHDFIGSCGDVACVHCGRLAWA